jgi:hypothetical protein
MTSILKKFICPGYLTRSPFLPYPEENYEESGIERILEEIRD